MLTHIRKDEMTQSTTQPAIQRQITLPLTKAIEIAWKNIRMRLSRSLLVTSGIVLALAFLISILTSESIINSMRNWIRDVPDSVAFDNLRFQNIQLTERIRPQEAQLQNLSRGQKLAKDRKPLDVNAAFGASLADLQTELGGLPGSMEELRASFTTRPQTVDKFRDWLATARQHKQVRDRLTAPQALEAEMKANGVPTSPAEIESNRIQTRWLLALALLVAFVGILNSMVMSVTERFREIGTMKCLGALNSFIIKLFLIESLFQGVVGTTIGLFLGFLLSLLALFSTYGQLVWQHAPWAELGQNMLFCLAVGVVLTVAGAVYPAWQAAKMEPIAAMRVEA